MISIVEAIICKSNAKDSDGDILDDNDIVDLYNHNHVLNYDINHNYDKLDNIITVDNRIDIYGNWVITIISLNDTLNDLLYNDKLYGVSLSSDYDRGVCGIPELKNKDNNMYNYSDFKMECWEPNFLSFVEHPSNKLPFTDLQIFNNDGERIK